MKGYKGMDKDMTCRGMHFEIGKTYHINGEIKLCENGIHFCEKLSNVFNFYDMDDSRYFEIEAFGTVKSDGNKSATSDITIIKELTNKEIAQAFYGCGYCDDASDYTGNGYGDSSGDGFGNCFGAFCFDSFGYGEGCGRVYNRGDANYYGYGSNCGNKSVDIHKILVFND